MKHYSAILFPISALHGPFGLGTLGNEAHDFVKTLRSKGFSYWQILPLGHVDETSSPYKSPSSFAGNPAYIDPRFLVADGLLPASDFAEEIYRGDPNIADYAFAYKNISEILKKAFANVGELLQKSIDSFYAEEKYWLEDYALFMTAKKINKGKAWWDWEDKELLKNKPEAREKLKQEQEKLYKYFIFEQWAFDRQWLSLKSKANKLGLGIIGDLPFYIDNDSADAWANQHLFTINEKGDCLSCAGVPPDYFSEMGQFWGNPLYVWEEHKKDNYAWWQNRIKRMMKIFDKLRLDHFRAFGNYWAIEAASKDARKGEWLLGPNMELLNLFFAKYDKSRFIAEDLGEYDEVLAKLIKDAGIANMYVLQFNIHPQADRNLPYKAFYNSVTYTGTHDNNTVLGWIWEQNEAQRSFILQYMNFSEKEDWGKGGPHSPICQSMIHLAWSTHSKLAVTCLQDICGYGEDTRINVPGRTGGNWCYRITREAWDAISWRSMERMNRIFKRDTPFEEQPLG